MSADDDLREMLETLRQDYRRSLPGTLERIETAWAAIAGGSADAACVRTLERALHSISGAAGTFGLPGLSKAAAAAETFVEPYVDRAAIPADQRERLRSLLDAVRTEASR